MDLIHTAYVPQGRGPFPTVIALHGFGANGMDLLGLAPHLAGGRLLVLCPQGPTSLSIGPGAVGYSWFPMQPGEPPDPRAFLKASTQLRTFVDDVLPRYPVDRSKVVVLGFSQGGLMGIDLTFRETERFAGLLVLSSWFPELLASNLPKKSQQQDFPVLLVHGSQDAQVDIERARESRPVFERFGVDLAYHEFPMGHEIRPEALRVIGQWLREKVLTVG